MAAMRVKEEVTMLARHWSVVASFEVVEVPGRVLYVAPASVISGVLRGSVWPFTVVVLPANASHSTVGVLQSAQLHELAGEQPDAWWQRDAWRQQLEACGRQWWWAGQVGGLGDGGRRTCAASRKFSSSVSEMAVVYVCISVTSSVSWWVPTSPLPTSPLGLNQLSKVFEAPHVK